MNLFFIAWGEYLGFKAAIQCAKERCGCKVHVVRDRKSSILESLLGNGQHDGGKLARATSLARWFVLLEGMKKMELSYPVFCADWDMMIFSNLEAACAPFLECDFARTVNHPNLGDTNAAYLVCKEEPLREFCSLVSSSNQNCDDPECHDMKVWREVADQGKWKVGDLTEIKNSSTFDLGVHCSLGKYRMAGASKLITFKDGHPYFTIDATGEQILAHNIHCWGEYKGREPELLKRARV